MKFNKLIIIAQFITATGCSGQTIKQSDMNAIKNDTTYTVWTTYECEGKDADGNYTNWSELHVNYEFVHSLPVPVKTIIAYYSAFISDYGFDKKTKLNFAQALGGFTTMEEARQSLLKDWNGKDISIEGYIYDLQLKSTTQSLFFEYGKKSDEFKIDDKGQIFYFPQPEPREKIPYSRKTLMDEYQFYRFMLNGKPIEFFNYFLDANNVQSVEVNKRDEIVYIEQKNKNPEYFVRADIANHLDSLSAFKVKSLNDIQAISIEDESTKNYFRQFYDEDKIETSAIKILGSWVDEDYGTKGVVVVLKQ